MATYEAETFSIIDNVYLVQNAYNDFIPVIFNNIDIEQLEYAEKPILITLLGSGINPIPIYFLAMFDSLGVRRYWLDTYPTTNGAPALNVGTYDLSTFVILGRY